MATYNLKSKFSEKELYYLKEALAAHIINELDYVPAEHPLISGATKMYDEIVELIGE